MPELWTESEQRQYHYIKKAALDSGWVACKAEAIAAHAVNRARYRAGETARLPRLGLDNYIGLYQKRSKQELYNLARQFKIRGRSRMSKADLLAALQAQR